MEQLVLASRYIYISGDFGYKRVEGCIGNFRISSYQ